MSNVDAEAAGEFVIHLLHLLDPRQSKLPKATRLELEDLLLRAAVLAGRWGRQALGDTDDTK